ncbi:hypothetical protein, partial [Prevotella sp.]|uniref:hypothetical protein n=1 Tax=Prevotella sp. TaxID=59823 RepID=UPI00307C82B8
RIRSALKTSITTRTKTIAFFCGDIHFLFYRGKVMIFITIQFAVSSFLHYNINYLYLYKPKTDNPQLPKIENAAAFL